MLLEVERLSAGYAGSSVVDQVSFSVGEGETVALLGRNGMGKTTLLRAIFGLAEHHGGTVRVDGVPLPPRRPELLARRGVTLVPDDRGVFPRLTVAENLQLAGLAGGRRGGARAALDPLELFPELRRRGRQPAGELSGGLQQQLALARALAAAPRLVAIDELSLGIQPSIVRQLAEGLDRVSKELGVALLVVDQSPALTLRICRRALIMRKGAIAVDAPSDELAASGAQYLDLLVI